jgi:nucleotide-binding universal stress UspA family protein
LLENPDEKGRGAAGHHHGLFHRRTPLVPALDLAIRQIAVEVDHSPAGNVRLNTAVHLAKATNAELLAFGIYSPSNGASTSAPLNAGMDSLPQALDPKAGITSAPRLTYLETSFRDKMRTAANVPFEWRAIPSTELETVRGLAKMADLTVLGRRSDSFSATSFGPEEIALHCGRPILLMPPKTRQATIGQNVIIAWDGSGQAARALHDAMPLLRDARHIQIVEVDRAAQTSGYPGASAAAGYLERHGFNATVSEEPALAESIAEALFDHVVAANADLLVAGLFHHSPTREAIFGGVSTELLRSCPVPVLLSH